MRASILISTFVLIGALSASAAVTVQAWYHLGEPGTLTGGLPLDSSGNGNNMNDGFSEFETVHTSANSPGGPLGTSGWTSTESSEWGRNGDVIIAARDDYYVSGDNFGIEAWVLPFGNGYNVFCCESSANYTAQIFASGGDSTGFFLGVMNNQDGTYSFVADIITDASGVVQVGDAVPLVTNGWTHLAVVRNNGTNTFYVNGQPSGASTTDIPSANVPTGTGQQAGMRLGASGGDHVAYRGLIDEARAFTFSPGQFSPTDLLYPSASANTPVLATQPANATVWDGGAVPFSVSAASGPVLSYQWKRNGVNLPNATNATLFLPVVTVAADNGSSYSCVLTNIANGASVVSSNAVLSVVPLLRDKTLDYEALIIGQTGLVAYFPMDHGANRGTLEGNATYDGRTDRSFGQLALAIDRAGNLGDETLTNDPDYSFPGGAGSIEAIVYMADLGVYTSASGWTYPTLFSIGDADRTIPNFTTLVGVSKTGDALEASPDGGTTILSWPVPQNLLGRFAYVAFVFDASAGITAYADGQSLGTQGSFVSIASSSPAWIGNMGSYTNSFTGPTWSGTIDELAIYTNALSAATVNADYAMFTYGTNTPPVVLSPPSPVTIFSGAALNSATFAVAAQGTLPLSYQWNSNNVAISGATNTSLSLSNLTISSSATYSVTVRNPVGTTNIAASLSVISPGGYPAEVIADSPVAYWRLGEASGPTALDSWGTNDGTYSGIEEFAQPGSDAGAVNTSVDFAGNGSSLVRVPYNPGFNGGLDPNGSWSVEAWVNPDLTAATEGGNFAVPIASVDLTQDRSGYFFLEQSDGWQLRLGNSGGYLPGWDGAAGSVGGVANSNTWYYLVGEYDGAAGMGYIYVNGVRVKAAAVSGLQNNTEATFNIGDRGDGAPFTGRIDEVAVYSGILSSNRVQAHFSAGPPPVTHPPVINVIRQAAAIQLTYSAGVLYQATNITGPYTPVSGAVSPYSIPTTGAQKFFLLRAH
jgi:hypothetical protein